MMWQMRVRSGVIGTGVWFAAVRAEFAHLGVGDYDAHRKAL